MRDAGRRPGTFAKHGKHTTVSVDDVKLCCRRSSSLLKFISRHGDSLRVANEGREEERRRGGGGRAARDTRTKQRNQKPSLLKPSVAFPLGHISVRTRRARPIPTQRAPRAPRGKLYVVYNIKRSNDHRSSKPGLQAFIYTLCRKLPHSPTNIVNIQIKINSA